VVESDGVMNPCRRCIITCEWIPESLICEKRKGNDAVGQEFLRIT